VAEAQIQANFTTEQPDKIGLAQTGTEGHCEAEEQEAPFGLDEREERLHRLNYPQST